MLKRIRNAVGRLLGFQPRAVVAPQRGSYDAARTSDEFKNYWANADRLDADSANSREVRHTLISRSRYEVANNAFSDGIAQTITNDLIGIGPNLRMQTSSEGFNKMVEQSWHLWGEAIQLRRKLWCMAHAKHVDGEGFAIMRRNPGVRHPIKIDLCLHEAEQVQTPFVPFNEPGYIDGIKFDDFGNPLWYDVLNQHPGTTLGMRMDLTPERVPAAAMLHWFRMRRPGQHRGVPEMGSALNCGAAARRWREATLSAAERAALMTLMMKTQTPPEEEDFTAPYSTMEIEKGLMNFLPIGWEPFQLDGKFPTTQHAEFNGDLIGEMGRAVNMPLNKAKADSSKYNYASGRLDHGTYYDSLDVGRIDCNALVLSRLFNVWFDLAVARFGWLGGNPDAIGPAARMHLWDWPKHRVADVEAEANANQTKLKSGQVSIPRLKAEAGVDAEDDVEQEAAYFGITVDELKKRQLDTIYPPVQQGGAPGQQPSADEAVAAMFRNLQHRGLLNGHANGVHANGN